jgi:S-adenosylmethionine hydrolase
VTRALITLTSDFGTADPYVAELKGVLLARGPDALTLVDLSHELPAHDVLAGALFLEAALPRFPPGCVHLAIVDPGVGSARRALLVRRGASYLVGPDNGLFGLVLQPGDAAFVLESRSLEALGLPAPSPTFHGRDLFAPAAAALARGVAPERFARPLAAAEPAVIGLALPRACSTPDACTGQVIHVDRFGNLISNLHAADLESLGTEPRVELAGQAIGRLRGHYAEVGAGEALALIGSAGRLEIAVNGASARLALGAERGSPVRVSRRPA